MGYLLRACACILGASHVRSGAKCVALTVLAADALTQTVGIGQAANGLACAQRLVPPFICWHPVERSCARGCALFQPKEPPQKACDTCSRPHATPGRCCVGSTRSGPSGRCRITQSCTCMTFRSCLDMMAMRRMCRAGARSCITQVDLDCILTFGSVRWGGSPSDATCMLSMYLSQAQLPALPLP